MILLDGATLALADLLAIADDFADVGLAPNARTRVVASRAVVEAKGAGPEAVYEVNTGFGSVAESRIETAGPCGSRRDGAARVCTGQGLIGHPCVHLALVLVGEGDTWDQGLRVDGALAAAGLTPVVLGPKEGLALMARCRRSRMTAHRRLTSTRSLNEFVVDNLMTQPVSLSTDFSLQIQFDKRLATA